MNPQGIHGMLERWLAFAARHTRWIVAFVALLVFLASAISLVRYWIKITEPSRDGTYTKSAILRWRPQLEALDRGEDIYAKYQYPNPPMMALILRPMVSLPIVANAMVWFIFKSILAAAILAIAIDLVGDGNRQLSLGSKVAVLALALHPLLGDLSHGNVNIFVAFVLFLGLAAIARGFDLAGGALIALGIACKVTPLLFVGYFGWKLLLGLWDAVRTRGPIFRSLYSSGGGVLIGLALGLGLWLWLVPGLALGFERNEQLLASWSNQMLKPFLVDGKVTSEHPNQSIPGVVFRLFTHQPSDTIYDEDGKPVPSDYANIADIGPDSAKNAVRGCQVAFVLLVAWLGRTRLASSRRGLAISAEYAIVLLGMLLFSERTWKHHATTTALPMAVLVAAMVWQRPRPFWIGGVLAVGFLLMTVPSFLGEKLQDFCMIYGTHAVGFLLLLVSVAAVLRAERRIDHP